METCVKVCIFEILTHLKGIEKSVLLIFAEINKGQKYEEWKGYSLT